MTEVIIRNKNLLNKLNNFVDEFFSIDGYDDESHRVFSNEEHVKNPEYYCDELWLKTMLDNWEAHSGFPEQHMAQPISRMVTNSPEKFTDFRNKVKNDFTAEIGAGNSALLSYYPAGGFVGWHTNWNANAYQILFTWSKTGNGYFKIDTTNGFVPPRGTDAQRPSAYAVIGMTRYNTTSKAIEVWDGAAWSSPAGASGAVSEIVANDIAASFALMLG